MIPANISGGTLDQEDPISEKKTGETYISADTPTGILERLPVRFHFRLAIHIRLRMGGERRVRHCSPYHERRDHEREYIRRFAVIPLELKFGHIADPARTPQTTQAADSFATLRLSPLPHLQGDTGDPEARGAGWGSA